MSRKKWRSKPPPQKKTALYYKIWRLADGAIQDTYKHHPEYFSKEIKGGWKSARMSIVKRVTGAIVGSAEQSARGPIRESGG